MQPFTFPPRYRRYLYPAFPIAVYLLLAFAVMVVTVEKSGLNYYGPAKLGLMIDGTANRPFVYRQLVPKIIGVIHAVTPDALREAVNVMVQDQGWSHRISQKLYLEPWQGYDGFWMLLMLYGSLIGYGYVMHRLARHFYPELPHLAWLAPMLAIAALPAFLKYCYLYDFPVLLLWAACVYAIAIGHFRLYLIFLALAMLNKETALLLPLLYALYYWDREPRDVFLKRLGIQFALLVVLRIALISIYQDNSGEHMKDFFGQQVEHWLSAYNHWQFIGLCVLFWLWTHRWAEKPLLLKRGMWMLLPFWLLHMRGGYVGEYRVFYELHPILMLLMAHTLASAMGNSGPQNPHPAPLP